MSHTDARYRFEEISPVIKTFQNPKGHQNPISGSKVMVILLKGWILPIGGSASRRVCACSLRSRLVFPWGFPNPDNWGEGAFENTNSNISWQDIVLAA